MKKILLITLVAVFAFSSCTKESMGVSKVTNYAKMTLNGDAVMSWEYGTPFVDPGCTGLEGTTDITADITVASDIDVNQIGRYHMTYKVLNSDGFAATTSRIVYVYKASDPRNGYYKSAVQRSYLGAAFTSRGPWNNAIMVFGNGTDELWIEDLIGGWYYIGSGYGIDYATAGVVKFDALDIATGVSGVEALPWGYVATLTAGNPTTYVALTKTLNLNVTIPEVPMVFKSVLSNPSPLN